MKKLLLSLTLLVFATAFSFAEEVKSSSIIRKEEKTLNVLEKKTCAVIETCRVIQISEDNDGVIIEVIVVVTCDCSTQEACDIARQLLS